MNTRNNLNQEIKNWLSQTYKEEKKPLSNLAKGLTRGAVLIGASIGVASAYVLYVLGAEFGENASAYLGIDDATQSSVLENLFGLTAAIPMAALAALNVKDSLETLTGPLIKSNPATQNIFKKKSCSELLARGLFAAAAPFSAIPQSTLTWNYTSNPSARIFFTTCAVVGPTFFNGRGGQKLIDHYKPKTKVILELENQLAQNLRAIKKMSLPEYRAFLQKLLNPEGEFAEDFLQTLVTVAPSNLHTEENTLLRILFSITGGLLGLISAIIFYQLSLEGLQDPLQLTQPALQHFFSTLSYLLNAALSSLATQQLFQKFYKILFVKDDRPEELSWPKLRKLFMGIAILIGPFAALPLGSLQIANAQSGELWQKLLIGPTFLGPMCVRSKAVYDLLNRCFDSLVNLLQKNSVFDAEREALFNTLEKFHQSLKEFRSEALDALQATPGSGTALLP